jgi:hypothetical protein
MKAKTLFVLLAAIVLALVVARLIHPRSQLQSEALRPATTAELPNSAPDSPISTRSQPQRENPLNKQEIRALEPLPPGSNSQERLIELSRERGVPLNVLTQQALAQWTDAVQQMSQQVNQPIEFYGKAVDNEGEPLRDALVHFGSVVFPETHFETNVLTDAGGMFALTGITGAVLTVQVSKEGYEELPGTNQNSFTYYSLSTLGGFHPDQRNPVIFHLRKKDQ